ncbi:hypothetical protein ABZ470_15640 [Streptosporangium sp. NPDC020072]|uniref:hypothetical protein n=1 Tax=Streptosporangium sp. NPDC020072 TaxID=3154788 RepID=UPI00344115B2
MSQPRRVRGAALLAALVAATGLTGLTSLTSPAHAAGSVTCDTAGTMYFKPGVQIVPLRQDIEIRGANGSCRDSTGLGIDEARLTANFSGVWLTCELGGGGTGHGTGTLDWIQDDGTRARSNLDLNFESNIASEVTLSGQVVGGPLDGERFSAHLSADLLRGTLKCTVGGPFGGAKSVGYHGEFTVG